MFGEWIGVQLWYTRGFVESRRQRTCSVYVSKADNEKALRESFGAHGAIKEVFIRAAFAFLVFENADDSQKALDASADLKIGDSDKPLVVQRKNQRETPADDDEQE
eukprot:TRINITY_DN3436_c0_g1_i4.p2 TRINITY_DN3436_c0_g1~~TRINITY_DN3436_c0_g1_i4.p2  ORF type:complete len:106 (+),score=44.02 TRINITY_DN3436_c0_g1_i4:405-722(+)